MNELNHTPGKGDKDRSPGWRHNYDQIDFHRCGETEGFARRGNHLVKAYGDRAARFVFPENEEHRVLACCEKAGDTGYMCSLPKGHSGNHIAQRLDNSVVHEWPVASTGWSRSGYTSPIYLGEPGFIPYGDPPDCGAVDCGYTCTRSSGHSGDHAAHVHEGQMSACWPQITADILVDDGMKL
jgi:hypothetical protein